MQNRLTNFNINNTFFKLNLNTKLIKINNWLILKLLKHGNIILKTTDI